MDFSASSGSKPVLKTRFHSDFKSRYKHIALDEFKQSLNSPLRSTRTSSFDFSKHNGLRAVKDPPELKLGHYQNLYLFKELAPCTKGNLFNAKGSGRNLKHSRQAEGQIWEKFSQNTLQKALNILKATPHPDICWAYKRQLRQFCLEVLSHFSA